MSASSNCLQLLEQLAQVLGIRFIKEFAEFKMNTYLLNLFNYVTE